jgi:hypothetical protein
MMMIYDDDMRTIIDLPQDQLGQLDGWCRLENISRAEAVRRAVADLLQRHRATTGRRAFGVWRERRLNGLKYQETLRREWDR